MTAQALAFEVPAHVAAIVLYGIASGAVLLGATMGGPKAMRAGHLVAVVALAVHSLALAARWYAVGHGPYLTRYEVLSANAWMVGAAFLVWRLKHREAEVLSTIVYPAALLLVGVGLYTGPQVKMLPPTFTGIWLVLHVLFYFVAFAAGLISLGYALVYLFGGARTRSRLSTVPDAETCDRESYRFAGLSFAFWGVGMLTGSIWAYYSWGRFWGWDPVESWSLVTWFAYGIYLHLRRFYGVKGKTAAAILFVGFLLAIGTLFFTSLLANSLHSEYFK